MKTPLTRHARGKKRDATLEKIDLQTYVLTQNLTFSNQNVCICSTITTGSTTNVHFLYN
jgi:hypothetical protein